MNGIAYATAAAKLANVHPGGVVRFADARRHLSALGISLRKTDFSEFRVNFRHGGESSAAYESTLADAVDTGLAMLRHRAKMAAELRTMGVPAATAESDAQAVFAL